MKKISVNVINGAVWLKQFLGETLLFFFFKIDNVRSEYGEILYFSDISNGIHEIDGVWNESNNETVTGKNTVNITAVFLLMMCY